MANTTAMAALDHKTDEMELNKFIGSLIAIIH